MWIKCEALGRYQRKKFRPTGSLRHQSSIQSPHAGAGQGSRELKKRGRSAMGSLDFFQRNQRIERPRAVFKMSHDVSLWPHFRISIPSFLRWCCRKVSVFSNQRLPFLQLAAPRQHPSVSHRPGRDGQGVLGQVFGLFFVPELVARIGCHVGTWSDTAMSLMFCCWSYNLWSLEDMFDAALRVISGHAYCDQILQDHRHLPCSSQT